MELVQLWLFQLMMREILPLLTKHNLPIERVIEGGETLPYTESGKLINSGEFDGLSSEEAKRSYS